MLIEYWQDDPELRGRWISAEALRVKFYPLLIEAYSLGPLPWLTVSKALKRVTKKRAKQLMLLRNGKRRRCCVVQFKIPR